MEFNGSLNVNLNFEYCLMLIAIFKNNDIPEKEKFCWSWVTMGNASNVPSRMPGLVSSLSNTATFPVMSQGGSQEAQIEPSIYNDGDGIGHP